MTKYTVIVHEISFSINKLSFYRTKKWLLPGKKACTLAQRNNKTDY